MSKEEIESLKSKTYTEINEMFNSKDKDLKTQSDEIIKLKEQLKAKEEECHEAYKIGFNEGGLAAADDVMNSM